MKDYSRPYLRLSYCIGCHKLNDTLKHWEEILTWMMRMENILLILSKWRKKCQFNICTDVSVSNQCRL